MIMLTKVSGKFQDLVAAGCKIGTPTLRVTILGAVLGIGETQLVGAFFMSEYFIQQPIESTVIMQENPSYRPLAPYVSDGLELVALVITGFIIGYIGGCIHRWIRRR